MMIPKNILNTTFKLVLLCPRKRDQPQGSGLAALLLKEQFSCCVQLTRYTLPGYLKFQWGGERRFRAPNDQVVYSNLSVVSGTVQLHNHASETLLNV